MRKLTLLLLLAFNVTLVACDGDRPVAGPGAPTGGGNPMSAGIPTPVDEFLPMDEAFRVGVEATAPDRIEVIFGVTPGYYLYRSRMKFAVPEGQPVALGTPDLPTGDIKKEEAGLGLGDQEVYHEDVVARIAVSRGSLDAFTLPVEVSYQGCAEAGLCYPPTTKTFQVEMPKASKVARLPAGGSGAVSGGGSFVSEEDRLAAMIRDGNIFLMAGAFFLAGLLLSFTPCVLPMVPIVAGIIAGEGANVARSRAFSLSLAYVLGMAATYTAAGVAFAAAGQQAQSLFQQTWIILLFSGLFVAMSLSMFGLYTVQMPAAVQTRLAMLSNRQRGGNYAGVVVMGALSALIVTTCVGPALVAALSVIGQSGEVTRGGIALFAMAIGMGMPLLAVGASAGRLLPRAGAWMDTVKQAMGAMMLGVAVWMLSRILPERVTMVLWVVPLAALAIILVRASWRTPGGRNAARLAAALVSVYAVFIVIGAARGAVNPLRPLQGPVERVQLPFERIKSIEDLNARVAAANAAGKTVMLDFYADWCVACKEMEHYTFPDPAVRAALANTVWLQADVTANDDIDKALQKHFGIYGPPTIVFFGTDGAERRAYRRSGYMEAGKFAPYVTAALQ